MGWIGIIAFVIVLLVLLVAAWASIRSSDDRRRGSAPTPIERAAADAGRTVGLPTVGQHDVDGAVTPAHLYDIEHDPTHSTVVRHPPGGGGA